MPRPPDCDGRSSCAMALQEEAELAQIGALSSNISAMLAIAKQLASSESKSA